jgi:membrane protease YdiL (CAAX protease family)
MPNDDHQRLDGDHSQSCRHCGLPVRAEARFCSHCGGRLGEASHGSAEIAAPSERWSLLAPALRLWLALLMASAVAGLLTYLFDENARLPIEIGELAVGVVLTLIFGWQMRGEVRPLLRRYGYRGGRHVEPIIALAAIAAIMTGYFALLGVIGIEEISYLDGYREQGWPLWTALLSIGFVPAFYEELALRGCIMSRLERIGSKNEALILQAVMFSVLHLLPAILISHFILGIILGLLRRRSKSLYPGMLVHLAWNASVVLQDAFAWPPV